MNKDNHIEVVYEKESILADRVEGIKITFIGHNNHIRISHKLIFNNCTFKLHSNNTFIFEESAYSISNLTIFANSNTHLYIGKDFSCLGCDMRLQENNVGIEIGHDCMLSRGICFYPTDGHAIFSIDTHELVNKGKTIKIGNHVWIGRRVSILKNASIADNCVVGFGSIVTGAIEQEHAVIAGYPARVIKSGINWSRSSPDIYEKNINTIYTNGKHSF